MATVTKECSTCKESFPSDSFQWSNKSKGIRVGFCKSCASDKRKMYYWSNPGKARESVAKSRARRKARDPEGLKRENKNHSLKRLYGITLEEYEIMYDIQDGRCYICDVYREKLHVDHNHSTGAVRDLLCTQCNVALGYAKEDSDILRSMIEYLGRWS